MLAAALPAYMLGSVNGAIITSKYLYRKDIRNYGSGNPGLTNFYRVFGKGGALLVVAIDVFKTVAPVLFGGWLLGRYFDMTLLGRTATGFFVMMGHCYPLYYRFEGGKGVMAVGTILFIVDWRIALISWGMFIIMTAVTRYVSLAAILGIIAYPVSQHFLKLGGLWELCAAVACTILLIARHHANIGRLIRKEESKFSFRRAR